MNVLERIKLKSRSLGITESRSFLVRYRRTYVLKKIKKRNPLINLKIRRAQFNGNSTGKKMS